MSFSSQKRINHRNWNLRLGDQGAVNDPYFADVLMLLNNQSTVTKDASNNNWSLTVISPGTIALNGPALFGYNTYQSTANGTTYAAHLGVNGGDKLVLGGILANEWCFEGWFYVPANISAGASPEYLFTVGSGTAFDLQLFADGHLVARCTNINGTGYACTTAAGVFTAGTWHFVTLVRDNSLGGNNCFIRLYVDGILLASSVAFNIAATCTNTANGFNCFIGTPSTPNSVKNWSNIRITNKHARYYANFTPPSGPFPTS
jgi:hypothetical protein